MTVPSTISRTYAYPADEGMIRESRREKNWLIREISFNAEYRKLLNSYAASVWKSNPSLARQCWRLLRAYPCQVGSDPNPETGRGPLLRSRRPWIPVPRGKIDE